MLIATFVLATIALPQQPAEAPEPEMAVLRADLGDCSADFTVKDAGGAPVYGATISVNVRYGLWGIRRADLEIGTNADGRARIDGLPDKARPLTYDIRKDGKGATVQQDVSTRCRAVHEVWLRDDVEDEKGQGR